MSQESIDSSQQQLTSFFIQLYSLKDALIQGKIVNGRDVEEAATDDPRLALLADLANLDKHTKLTKPPRSGHVPSYEQVSGVNNSTGSGWHLCLKVKHNTSVLDGIEIAQNAVTAWKEKLTGWRLI
ncbi:hypothetical protein A3194_12285 [Candidatus Thiodiazotropha endoloripes]|nr:hypothetical protein A3194_12285 [Candidatus Thiodiazotropha endoloripes]